MKLLLSFNVLLLFLIQLEAKQQEGVISFELFVNEYRSKGLSTDSIDINGIIINGKKAPFYFDFAHKDSLFRSESSDLVLKPDYINFNDAGSCIIYFHAFINEDNEVQALNSNCIVKVSESNNVSFYNYNKLFKTHFVNVAINEENDPNKSCYRAKKKCFNKLILKLDPEFCEMEPKDFKVYKKKIPFFEDGFLNFKFLEIS